jgi:glycosyltransferase involved in cell wall biosynthesis
MQRVKLLYVITKLELGGAQKQLLNLIRGLDKEKFTPFLFTAKEGLILNETLSIPGLTVKTSKWLERPINPLKDFLALFEVYQFIKKNKITIVHTHSSKAGILGRLAARLAKVRFLIHTVHGWSFNDYQPLVLRRLFIFLERIVGKFTDRIIVVSYHDKEKGMNNGIGKEGKYVIIRYGIDYTEFRKRNQNIRRELGINLDDLLVTNISCLKPQKSPLDFVKLSSLVNQNLPNVKFLLVGDGQLRENIEGFISRFGLKHNFILTGWRQDIPEILSATDILVLTSLWEGLPIVALEAMAVGLPVVATSTGGVEEVVIDGETGFIVAQKDMYKMSERLATLLKDSDLKRRMGENAKNNLDSNFTIQEMVKNNQSLYENLITKGVGHGN